MKGGRSRVAWDGTTSHGTCTTRKIICNAPGRVDKFVDATTLDTLTVLSHLAIIWQHASSPLIVLHNDESGLGRR
eukprot:2765494-Pyramimonas_sp.AAC.1